MSEQDEFDEDTYLDLHPDVAAVVRAGAIASGWEHYDSFGRMERRATSRTVRLAPLPLPFPADLRPNRRDKILAGLDLPSLDGVEIGALDRPMVTRQEGPIFYIDHADTAEIKRKYRNDPAVHNESIVDVDAIWGSQTLRECVGGGRTFDYVVASHVVEHVPDLITWLQEIRSVLKQSGTLRLAVPDRRYSFDYLRNESRIQDVLDAYLRKARIPQPRMLLEFAAYASYVDCQDAWRGTLDGSSLRRFSTVTSGIDFARNSLQTGTYHDTHCWVFTPITFSELFIEIAKVGLMPFGFDYCFETPLNELEFIVGMNPMSDQARIVESWETMRQQLATSDTYQR